jgi:Ulp1 family protease
MKVADSLSSTWDFEEVESETKLVRKRIVDAFQASTNYVMSDKVMQQTNGYDCATEVCQIIRFYAQDG